MVLESDTEDGEIQYSTNLKIPGDNLVHVQIRVSTVRQFLPPDS